MVHQSPFSGAFFMPMPEKSGALGQVHKAMPFLHVLYYVFSSV